MDCEGVGSLCEGVEVGGEEEVVEQGVEEEEGDVVFYGAARVQAEGGV